MINLILCGGSGTRLWPISRTLLPKQFVRLFDNSSLFQFTVRRNLKVCSGVFVVSNAEQYFLALDQLEELGQECDHYMLEPVGRNTAPAIALACFALDSESLVLVTPSDHLIKDEKSYIKAVKRAQELAESGSLVTFGIKPSYPETGFGYIEADGENVKAFYEKPTSAKAEEYVKSGNFYWNSGIFCFKAGVFLEELKKFAPDIYDAAFIAYENVNHDGLIRIRHEDMAAIPENSIDYAVMEKSDKVKVVPASIGWSDLGSFDALYDELEKDEHGNTLSDKFITLNSKNNLFYGGKRVVAAVDIDDSIIIDTPDALLVTRRGSSQKVKDILCQIRQKDISLSHAHMTTYRPWGSYTVLEDAPMYKIKRLVVKPGKRLSLQKHLHRSEHWIVVSGTATVTVGGKTELLRQNESTYIRIGEIHRLGNDGKIPVVIIEAQVGEYTGEDDIIRMDDDFDRNKQ